MRKSRTHLPAGRKKLVKVLEVSGDVVTIDDTVKTLNLSRTQAAKLLSRWTEQGWLRRAGAGVYVPVQIEMLDAEHVVQDPWILVPALFNPAYIGGFTAAYHWDLTEQIFRDTAVFTSRRLGVKSLRRQGTVFTFFPVRNVHIFGTKSVWRGQTRIAVSDINRTIVDMLNNPACGGGIQHVADCFEQYVRREDSDPDKLIAYADRIGNGAVFKRLGFLAELSEGGTELIASCKTRLTKGNALLDPKLECPRLITRWRLRVSDMWAKRGASV